MGTTIPNGVVAEVPYALLKNFNMDIGPFTVVIKDRNGRVRDWPMTLDRLRGGIPFYTGETVKIITRAPVRGAMRVADIYNVNPITGVEVFDSEIGFTAALQRSSNVSVTEVESDYTLATATARAAGYNYVVGETLTLDGGTPGPAATLIITHLQATAAIVATAGSNHAPGDQVVIDGGAGNKATVAVSTVSAMSATVPSFEKSGVGYLIGDTLSPVGGSASVPAVIRINEAQMRTASNFSSGRDYQVGEKLRLVGGSAVTAGTLTVNSVTAKSVPEIVGAGSYYVPSEVLTVAGGVTATPATISVETVKAVEMVVPSFESSGAGYSIGELVTLEGGASTVPAQYYVNNLQAIQVAQFTNGGSNYQVGDTLQLTGGAFITPARLTVTDVLGDGAINLSGATVSTRGDYSAILNTFPTITVTGTGSNAFVQVMFGILGGTIAQAGTYTVIPPNPVQTVFEDGGMNAEFNVKWGIHRANCDGGTYTAPPLNPVVQASSTGTGEGASFTLGYGAQGVNVTTRGDYQALPVNPVTTASFTGTGYDARFDIGWGVLTGTVASRGTYSDIPTSPMSTTTNGGGAGALINVVWGARNLTVVNSGSYTAVPPVPAAQYSSTGTGSNLKANMSFGPLTVATGTVGFYDEVPTNPVGVTTNGIGVSAEFDTSWTAQEGAVRKTTSNDV